MLKHILIALALTTGILRTAVLPAQAHELKTDGPISSLIHINPDDDPVAGQPSELLFLITDKQKKFNPEDCNCTASVIDNNETVFSSVLFKAKSSYRGIFAPAIPYTFPHKGVYTVKLTGEPKNPGGFQSFSVSYDIRIEKDQPAPKKSPAINILYILIIGGVLGGIIYFIKLFFTTSNNFNFDEQSNKIMKLKNEHADTPQKTDPDSKTNDLRRILFYLIGGILLIMAAVGASYAWAYKQTRPVLQHPQQAHYHLRLQIINNGEPVDFSKDNFQKPYDKLSCSVTLPAEPIHFHDNLDQFVHVHWHGITGGMVLKNYGWNEIGGNARVLGYRFDESWWPRAVATHGNVLPQRSDKINYYIYTGDETGHQLRKWPEFLTQDLEVFFANTTPPRNAETLSASTTNHDTSANLELTRINNLLGNAVLFVQENEPTDEEVQKYFNNLIDLPESTCGG